MEKQEWLESLKPGDNVIVESNGLGFQTRLTQVDRITKTMIIVADIRFNKKWGTYGSGFDTVHLYQPTPKRVEAWDRERIISRLCQWHRHWDRLNTDSLKKIEQCCIDLGMPGTLQ